MTVVLSPLPAVWIYCSSCGRRKRINPSCGKRNCKRCQFKRSKRLEKKYLNAILKKPNVHGHMWTFVNLTGIHLAVNKQSLASDLRKFGNIIQQFLSEEYPDAGLAVIEHTTRVKITRLVEVLEEGEFYGCSLQGPGTLIGYDYGLYLHGHAVCYGGYKDKIGFEKRWAAKLIEAGFLDAEIAARNDDRRFVGLELVRNPKQAARYILKYVAKGVELSDEYIEVLKRLKYVRSWGFLYGMKEPTFDLICDFCGGNCYVTLDEGQLVEYFGEILDPLKIQRVQRLPETVSKKKSGATAQIG